MHLHWDPRCALGGKPAIIYCIPITSPLPLHTLTIVRGQPSVNRSQSLKRPGALEKRLGQKSGGGICPRALPGQQWSDRGRDGYGVAVRCVGSGIGLRLLVCSAWDNPESEKRRGGGGAGGLRGDGGGKVPYKLPKPGVESTAPKYCSMLFFLIHDRCGQVHLIYSAN